MINWRNVLNENQAEIKVGVYALITAKSVGIIEPSLFYFSKYCFDDSGLWWLESGSNALVENPIPDDEDAFDYTCGKYGLLELEKDVCAEEFFKEFVEPYIIDGIYYQIETFQHSPLLPQEVDEFSLISSKDAILHLLSKRTRKYKG